MPSMMSFSLTIPQMRDQSKTLTTRLPETWKNLMAGDRVYAVEKSMGLKKGEKVKRIGLIQIVRVSVEPLGQMTKRDCRFEGFPNMVPAQFLAMLSKHYGREFTAYTQMRRIRFLHLATDCAVQERLA